MCRQNAQEYNMNPITQKSTASVYQNKKFTANCIKNSQKIKLVLSIKLTF